METDAMQRFSLRTLTVVILIGDLLCAPGCQPNSQPARPAAADASLTTELFKNLEWNELALGFPPREPLDKGQFPERVLALDGKVVRLCGYMLPYDRTQGIEEFDLLAETNKPEFYNLNGSPADCPLHYNMPVRLKPGETASWRQKRITVTGRLSIDIYTGPDNRTWSLYRLDDASVTPARPREGYHQAVGPGC